MFKYSNSWGWKAKFKEATWDRLWELGKEINSGKITKILNFRMLLLPRFQKLACFCSGLVITCHTHSATQPILQSCEGRREELQEILLQGKQLRVCIWLGQGHLATLSRVPQPREKCCNNYVDAASMWRSFQCKWHFHNLSINTFADNKKTFYLVPFAGHKLK